MILTSHTPIECVALFQFISFMKGMKKLSFRDCIMEYLAFCELAKLLMKDNEITQLSLQHLDMKDPDMKLINDALSNENCKLTNLNINDNLLTSESAKYLSNSLKSDNCQLTDINIDGNQLTDEGIKYLCDALENFNCKLTNLGISYNSLHMRQLNT